MRSTLPFTPQKCFAAARDEAEIQSLLNNDVYKFLMLDFILAHKEYRDVEVRWKMKVRTPGVRLANVIPEAALREQLDAARAISGVSPAEISYLRGMLTTSGRPIFQERTLAFLQDFRLPDYRLENDGEGNFELSFTGPWKTSMMWEILALKIVNTLYLYHYVKKAKLSAAEFNGVMTRTFARLYDDVETFREHPGLTFSEFGTRRSASTDIHRMVLEILENELPGQCLGTSNVMLAREFGSNNPRGTNAHELRMVPTAMVDDPESIVDTMYRIDREWMAHYPELAILLPDTFGTGFYLKNAPEDILKGHVGCRFDSKDPRIAIPEYVDWLLRNGEDPKTKVAIPSDGLDARSALDIAHRCSSKVGKLTFGIGTNLTNNTKGTMPSHKSIFGPFGSFSVVVKPDAAFRTEESRWVSTVKLSDNPNKAMGSPERVELFKKTFGIEGMEAAETVV